MRKRISIAFVLLPLVAAAAEIDFNLEIRPILSNKCFHCHGFDGKKRKAKLRLDTFEGATRDLGGHAAIVPGKPEQSELMERVEHHDPEERMPPQKSGRTVQSAEIAKLRQWISEGAVYLKHWAWVAPTRQPVPAGHEKTPIDGFVLQRLKAVGLKPSPPTTRETLIRRATLDLTGLPPTPKEADAFLADSRPDDQAFETVVDRLLASPRYGEHMAYRWLDAARYADSDGYESDPLRTMWPWRDWVIAAFNDNMPYDQFITEQLAGDLLPNASLRQRIASGYNRNNRLNNEGGILAEEWLIENVADRAETVATTFMGLTWGCARCHDHKYDPISQRDYYQLFSYFYNCEESGIGRGASGAGGMLAVPPFKNLEEFETIDAELQSITQKIKAYETHPGTKARLKVWMAKIADAKQSNLPAALKKKDFKKWSAADKALARSHFLTKVDSKGVALSKRVATIKKRHAALLKAGAKIMVMKELPKPRQAHLLHRGAFDKPGEKVDAGVPGWIHPGNAELPKNRIGLAAWLTDPKHPLTARVAVNGFWERYFGTGLVKTMEDFGSQGEAPSHPELLDYLALALIDSGWDVKRFQKQIVMSGTYRQSAATNEQLVRRDPDNRLLAHGPRFRLPAQVIRDQALAASGLLVETIGGRPVKPYQPPGLWKEVIKGGPTYKADTGDRLYRRSLYTLWRRAVKPPLMVMFDANERDTCKVGQRRTNTPMQALSLLNSTTFVEAARHLGERMITQGGADPGDRISHGVKLLFGRPATAVELDLLGQELSYFKKVYADDPKAAAALLTIGGSKPNPKLKPPELAAYTLVARVLLNLDETVTKE